MKISKKIALQLPKQDFYSFKLCTVDKVHAVRPVDNNNDMPFPNQKFRSSWSVADDAFWLKSATGIYAVDVLLLHNVIMLLLLATLCHSSSITLLQCFVSK